MSWPWKHAVIVGASSGMGEELACRLAEGGCRVALVARREEELRRVADRIDNSHPGLASVYVHDVREYECVPALFQTIARDRARRFQIS